MCNCSALGVRKKMLTENDITFFRRRIEEVLRDGNPTEWQRQFLSDVRSKFSRYGLRTRLSDKQLAILRRLTGETTKLPPEVVTERHRPEAQRPRSLPVALRSTRPFGKNPLRRNPLRIRNPLRPPRVFRRSAYSAAPSGVGSRTVLAALALVMFVGVVGSFFGGGQATLDDRPEIPPVVEQSAKVQNVVKARFTITDGDTIRLNDGTRVRLIGFNTPEKFEPRCSAEAALGNRASARLKELVSSAKTTEVTLVPCACRPGTAGTKKCNYGRSCGTLLVDGRDVGQTLISERLAVSFVCGATGCPPTPRPWCG